MDGTGCAYHYLLLNVSEGSESYRAGMEQERLRYSEDALISEKAA